jgi:hypothetical protein
LRPQFQSKHSEKAYETQHKSYNKNDFAISYIFNMVNTQTHSYAQGKEPNSAAVFNQLKL